MWKLLVLILAMVWVGGGAVLAADFNYAKPMDFEAYSTEEAKKNKLREAEIQIIESQHCGSSPDPFSSGAFDRCRPKVAPSDHLDRYIDAPGANSPTSRMHEGSPSHQWREYSKENWKRAN